jgi:hypothetical protein
MIVYKWHQAFREMVDAREKMQDPKAWAYRIMENPSKYPDIAQRFAKEAIFTKSIMHK